jgi:hypothetical protein
MAENVISSLALFSQQRASVVALLQQLAGLD